MVKMHLEPVRNSGVVPREVRTRRVPRSLVAFVPPRPAGSLPSSNQPGVRTWAGAAHWDRTPAGAWGSCRSIDCPGCMGGCLLAVGYRFVNWSGRG